MNNTPKHLVEEIINLYIKEKLSLYEIAEKLKISHSTVRNYLERNKIPRRALTESNRTHQVNTSYFSCVDTPTKSQILGFIYADGCVSRDEEKNYSHRLSITLHQKDENYLDFIKRETGYTGGILRSHYEGSYENAGPQSRLGISSKEIFFDLQRLGVGQRKSLTLLFPTTVQVPTNLLPHFIRGYLEGDGSICVRHHKKKGKESRWLSGTVSFCGTLEFLTRLKEIIFESLNITSVISQKKNLKERRINSHSLVLSGNKHVLEFLRWIYRGYGTDFDFVMGRKRQKYLDLKKDYEHYLSMADELKVEFKAKMSKIVTGRVVSAETREKCRIGNLEQAKLHKYREVWAQTPMGKFIIFAESNIFARNLGYITFVSAI